MTVSVTKDSRGVYLDAHYLSSVPKRARAIGGKFDKITKAWVFDQDDYEDVYHLAVNLYGYQQPTVRIRYTVDCSLREYDVKSVEKFGRTILYRPNRDNEVRLGEKVKIVKGEFPSTGGSSKYPSVTGRSTGDKVILEIKEVPINLIDPEDEFVEIVGDKRDFNPLEGFSDQDIIDEAKRRGLA